METAGAERTSEVELEGFKMMNRWMKRRIERSRARCEASEKHVSVRVDSHQTVSRVLPNSFAGIAEKQSSKLRSQAEVQQ